MGVWVDACTYVCMYVCMRVCVYVCMCQYVRLTGWISASAMETARRGIRGAVHACGLVVATPRRAARRDMVKVHQRQKCDLWTFGRVDVWVCMCGCVDVCKPSQRRVGSRGGVLWLVVCLGGRARDQVHGARTKKASVASYCCPSPNATHQRCLQARGPPQHPLRGPAPLHLHDADGPPQHT